LKRVKSATCGIKHNILMWYHWCDIILTSYHSCVILALCNVLYICKRSFHLRILPMYLLILHLVLSILTLCSFFFSVLLYKTVFLYWMNTTG
jgi:hypothetical protein